MGVVVEAANVVSRLFRPTNFESWSGVSRYLDGRPQFADGKYTTYAKEGYSANALVFACIEELATSAAEPEMQAMQADKWHGFYDSGASASSRLLALLRNPNPFMDHFEFWATVILHRSIAGNAFALKVRSRSGRPVELWLLRPDRVSIVPDSARFISRYEYNVGDREPVRIPVDDIIHFRTRNPLDDFRGMPPLMAMGLVVDVDNDALEFVSQYFKRAGVPSGMLTTKTRLQADQVKELQARFTREYGDGKWHGLMVLDGAEASYTAMTQSLGTQGLVLPELNKIVEARITGGFGVPPTLVGAVIGTEASSYGNKRSERESFWNETLKPLYRELAGPLNRVLVPEFPGVQQVAFDLSTVGALREDDDKLHARLRADYAAGIITRQEARVDVGREPEVTDGTFLIPANMTITPASEADKAPELPEPTAPLPAPVPASNGNGR